MEQAYSDSLAPGKYKVSLAKRVGGVVTPLAGPVEFTVKYVGPSPLPADDLKQLTEFQKQVIKLQRDLTATQGTAGELANRLEQIKLALDQTPSAPPENRDRVRKLIAEHRETVRRLSGDAALRGRNENSPMSIAERVAVAGGATRTLLNKPTGTAWHLAQKAVVIIDPVEHRGEVVWPKPSSG